MRPGQFWFLLAASFLVTGLLFRGIFLYRAVDKEHRVLVDSQQAASTAAQYQRIWKSIAARLYEASPQDPALAQLLKDQHIEVHPYEANTAPAPNSAESGLTPEPVSTNDAAATPATTLATPAASPATASGGLPVPTLDNVKP